MYCILRIKLTFNALLPTRLVPHVVPPASGLQRSAADVVGELHAAGARVIHRIVEVGEASGTQKGLWVHLGPDQGRIRRRRLCTLCP